MFKTGKKCREELSALNEQYHKSLSLISEERQKVKQLEEFMMRMGSLMEFSLTLIKKNIDAEEYPNGHKMEWIDAEEDITHLLQDFEIIKLLKSK